MKSFLNATALGTSLLSLAIVPMYAARAASANDEAKPARVNAEGSFGVEEIIVTARRREESLQSVPVAVTAFTQSDLLKRGNFGAESLAESVPSLTFLNGVGTRSDIIFTLRGQSKVFGGRFPSTVVYFSDVPVFRITNGQFYDLQSVQVLRGPQGTLFGRVTDGGNIMIAPAKPANAFGGYVDVTAGNYSLRHISGALNIPIVEDKILFRAAFDVNRRHGFTRNTTTGRDLDDIHYDSFRASLVLKPTENLENYTIYSYNQADENGSSTKLSFVNPALSGGGLIQRLTGNAPAFLAALQALGPRTVSVGSLAYGSDGGNFNRRHDHYVINTTTWSPFSNLKIKNILGYIRVKNHWGTDYDGSPLPIIDTPNPFLPHFDYYYEQYSEEFQVQGQVGTKLNYTVGTYWDSLRPGGPAENNTVNFGTVIRDDVQYQKTRSKAAYGQVGYDLGGVLPGLKMDAGMRYTIDHTKADYTSLRGVLPTPPYTAAAYSAAQDKIPHGVCNAATKCLTAKTSSRAFTWTAGLDYQINRKVLVYGKVSRGYRPGGFNASTVAGLPVEYKPEYDTSVEIGSKLDYDVSTVHLRTNVAIFRDRYSKIQKAVSKVIAGVPYTYITNALDAKIQGIEVEQTIIPFDGLNLGVKWSHIKARYDKQSAADLAIACVPSSTIFCSLNKLQGTPKNQLTVDAHYTLPVDPTIGEIRVGGSYFTRSSMAAGDSNYLSVVTGTIPGIGLASFDIRWNSVFNSRVDARFFMTNAFNKVYITGSNPFERNLGISSLQYGEPRMWGFSLRYNLGDN
jgi:iron complex outermembrane receptor protein